MILTAKKYALKLSAIVTLSVLSSYPIYAATINLSYNGAADTEKNAVHLFVSNVKSIVEKETEGSLEIKLFPNSILGGEQERMEQVINSPSLNVASFGGISPLFPEIFVSSIPFQFDSFEQARNFFDHGKYWEKARSEFYKKTNAHILAVVEEGGFLAFTNNKKEIKSPKDFEGLKFRAMDKSQVALYKGFGASGTPIPWTEVYMALKTGVADGQMNPPMYIIMGSLYEVQKYMTLANVQYSDQFLVANDALLKSLTEKEKEILLSAVKRANDINRVEVEKTVNQRISYLEEKGMKVYRPTNDELIEFSKLSKDSYIAWLLEQGVDESWIKLATDDL
ncbi:TRAP transporter substrate-binding protein DctP [Psychromonas sp. SA13A]|uniref:TRAP transporter substrate-binding protein DctP n=1 Tax=Psychromonas sp. SA13A TaxID=2686346 RepID=UPI00140D21E5|nr:TRAP transporter substrate-binding protein DctP [Psychromonas sp. SA13A]